MKRSHLKLLVLILLFSNIPFLVNNTNQFYKEANQKSEMVLKSSNMIEHDTDMELLETYHVLTDVYNHNSDMQYNESGITFSTIKNITTEISDIKDSNTQRFQISDYGIEFNNYSFFFPSIYSQIIAKINFTITQITNISCLQFKLGVFLWNQSINTYLDEVKIYLENSTGILPQSNKLLGDCYYDANDTLIRNNYLGLHGAQTRTPKPLNAKYSDLILYPGEYNFVINTMELTNIDFINVEIGIYNPKTPNINSTTTNHDEIMIADSEGNFLDETLDNCTMHFAYYGIQHYDIEDIDFTLKYQRLSNTFEYKITSSNYTNSSLNHSFYNVKFSYITNIPIDFKIQYKFEFNVKFPKNNNKYNSTLNENKIAFTTECFEKFRVSYMYVDNKFPIISYKHANFVNISDTWSLINASATGDLINGFDPSTIPIIPNYYNISLQHLNANFSVTNVITNAYCKEGNLPLNTVIVNKNVNLTLNTIKDINWNNITITNKINEVDYYPENKTITVGHIDNQTANITYISNNGDLGFFELNLFVLYYKQCTLEVRDNLGRLIPAEILIDNEVYNIDDGVLKVYLLSKEHNVSIYNCNWTVTVSSEWGHYDFDFDLPFKYNFSCNFTIKLTPTKYSDDPLRSANVYINNEQVNLTDFQYNGLLLEDSYHIVVNGTDITYFDEDFEIIYMGNNTIEITSNYIPPSDDKPDNDNEPDNPSENPATIDGFNLYILSMIGMLYILTCKHKKSN